MSRWIGIALGDVTGIGPEVALKALAQESGSADERFLLIGDEHQAQAVNQRLALGLELKPYNKKASSGRFFVLNPTGVLLPNNLGPGSPEAARAAVTWVCEGAQRCLKGELDALVTAPVNKEAIIRAGMPFV